jgi:LysM repeat protein
MEDSLYALEKALHATVVLVQPIIVNPIPADSSDTLAGGTPTTTPIANYIYHKVSAGETMNSIATKYGVTIEKIMEWNALKTTNIYVGQRLQLLTGAGGTTQTQQQTPAAPVKKYYNVRAGDTFSKIAQRNGLSQTQLSKLNPGVNINKLTVGQRLRVK